MMAFTVEDGTQVAGANAYISVADWKAHHDDRGRAYTAYSDAQIEQAIVKASDYLDKRFMGRFRGYRAGTVQGMEWPRGAAYDNDGRELTLVPAALLKAAAEYGYIAAGLGTELAPNPADVAGSVTLEKIGPITTEYGPGTKPPTSTGNLIQNIPEYPEADLWVEQLLVTGASRRLVRG